MKLKIITLIAVLVILSCDNTPVTTRDPLEPVNMVIGSHAWSFEEKGITAVPGGDFIKIEWYRPHSSLNFKYYQLERTTEIDFSENEPINFEPLVQVPGFFDTTYVDTASIVIGDDYFYRVSVVNVDEKLSEYSDTVFFQLGPKPSVSVLSVIITDTTRDVPFSIDLNNPAIPEPVYLRIYNRPVESKVIIALLEQSKFYEGNGRGTFLLSELEDYETGKLISVRTDITEPDKIQMIPGGQYQVRIDYVGPEAEQIDGKLVALSGAKSQWVQFDY